MSDDVLCQVDSVDVHESVLSDSRQSRPGTQVCHMSISFVLCASLLITH